MFNNHSIVINDDDFSSSDNNNGKPQKTPKALVILFGWWGASQRPLRKYVDRLYQPQDCLTMRVILDKNAVNWLHVPSIETCARTVIRQAAALLRQHNGAGGGDDNNNNNGNGEPAQIPIIFHAFSNGGLYVVERIEQIIIAAQQHQQTSKGADGAHAMNADALVVGQHLQGQILDSTPCYLSDQTAQRAIGSAFDGIVLQTVATLCCVVFLAYQRLYYTYWRGEREYRWIFWDNVQEQTVCRRQAFVYSRSDAITGTVHLEPFIARRRGLNEITVVQSFDKSGHVLHMKEHPAEYEDFVRGFLSLVLSSLSSSSSLAEKTK